jgi:hypothetical protein
MARFYLFMASDSIDPTTRQVRYTAAMPMVIFGAGASYGSWPDFPPPQPLNTRELWRPPLANALFSNPATMPFSHIIKKYPKLTPRPSLSPQPPRKQKR